MAGSFQTRNGNSCFMKLEDFFEQLSDYQILRSNSAP